MVGAPAAPRPTLRAGAVGKGALCPRGHLEGLDQRRGEKTGSQREDTGPRSHSKSSGAPVPASALSSERWTSSLPEEAAVVSHTSYHTPQASAVAPGGAGRGRPAGCVLWVGRQQGQLPKTCSGQATSPTSAPQGVRP